MKNVYLNIRISEELKKEFDEKCRDNMQVASEVVRRLMEEYLKRGMDLFQKEEDSIKI